MPLSLFSSSPDGRCETSHTAPSKNPYASVLDRLFLDVISSAGEAQFQLWAECGTLLGVIRDRDYIPWETDLDFGARAAEIGQNQVARFKSMMESLGYEVLLHESYWNIRVPDSECHADINFYVLSGNLAIVPLRGTGNSIVARTIDSALRIVDQRPLGVIAESDRLRDIWRIRLSRIFKGLPRPIRACGTMILETLRERLLVDTSWRVPANFVATSRFQNFRGMKIKVPMEAESYLAFRYGSDWMIPRRDWDTWKQDATIVSKARLKK